MIDVDKELAKAEDTAAGQKEYVKTIEPKDPKAWIIRLCVESYIDEAESEKKRLLGIVGKEQAKNRDIKDLAERLAMELERLSPGHELANATLALLLENKMKAGQDPATRKKK